MKIFRFSITYIPLIIMLFACDQQETQILEKDQTDVKSESFTESIFEDTESLTTLISLASDPALGGRQENLDDKFCDAAVIQFQHQIADDPDSLIVDFGSVGCTDLKGNIRKGMIILIFSGDRKLSHTIIFNDFYLNGKLIEGTRTVSRTSIFPLTTQITLTGGKITWPDNSYATREASHTRVYNLNLQEPQSETIVLLKGGSAVGINRKGKNYAVEITNDIVFKRSCNELPIFIPVSGTKVIQVGEKNIIIDYGDGACDNKATLTVNGVSKEISLTDE